MNIVLWCRFPFWRSFPYLFLELNVNTKKFPICRLPKITDMDGWKQQEKGLIAATYHRMYPNCDILTIMVSADMQRISWCLGHHSRKYPENTTSPSYWMLVLNTILAGVYLLKSWSKYSDIKRDWFIFIIEHFHWVMFASPDGWKVAWTSVISKTQFTTTYSHYFILFHITVWCLLLHDV